MNIVHKLSHGWSAERVLRGYAYPRNGNLHNPTPRYSYLVRDSSGKLMGTVGTLKGAREMACDCEE